MLYGILLSVLILVSILLVVCVLLQSDKGGGLAGTLGGMGGGGMPLSGREAATLLSKFTTGLAIAFMVICIVLNLLSRNRATGGNYDSALQKRAQKIKTIESRAASSVLDQNLPPAPPPTAPGGEAGKINIPGVTEPAAPAPAKENGQ